MDPEELQDIFRSIGPISVRRMFGGQGVYTEGRILAIVYQGELLLKADQESSPAFAAAGSRQWSYSGKEGEKDVHMPYWSIPDDAWDDPDLMEGWVRLAREAAYRAQKPARKPAKSKKKAG